MVESKDTVLQIAKELIDDLRQTYHIYQAYLFGSYAIDKAREDSDIDVAVILDSPTYEQEMDVFRRAHKRDIRMEALCFSKADFDKSNLSIIPEIKTKGIPLI